ncbi:DUF2834 domain-containing protein [Sphingopyxis sp.]|uniref:DUF2834 domain-containing protein n=1 Tax=Sphingopyxis sp. TaxID=1908224 RepID=UPI003D0C79BE
MGGPIRHGLYVLIAFVSAGLAWYYGIAWMQGGGNILNLPSFFLDAFRSGDAAAFLTVDILAAWIVYMIWVVPDAVRIGLGARTGWLFLVLSFIGTCFAFPLYLVRRERHLAKAGQTG